MRKTMETDNTASTFGISNDCPFKDRYMMTFFDASLYYGISADEITDMLEEADAHFALLIGEEVYIKREAFENYLDDHYSI